MKKKKEQSGIASIAIVAIVVTVVVGAVVVVTLLKPEEAGVYGPTTSPTAPPTATTPTTTPTTTTIHLTPQHGEYFTYMGNKSKILLIDSHVGYCTIEFDSPPYGANVGDPGIVITGTIKNEYDRDYWVCMSARAFNSEGVKIGHSIDLGPIAGVIALHVWSGQTRDFELHLKYREDIERIELFIGCVSEIPPP